MFFLRNNRFENFEKGGRGGGGGAFNRSNTVIAKRLRDTILKQDERKVQNEKQEVNFRIDMSIFY